ncbi:uncharacterized protein LOC127975954 [Carassius gibelio]|uniref:uncharacterized protein LOC127975954 n=1 Tax=Carassius gibelio TaxID=101364 RepID=UPI002279988D|nr:uncharacterized protein LOC127975954 [Carassius gibelio]
MAESTRHITIQNGDALPELQQCNKCCSNYHCPFCAASVFKPAKLVKLKTHLQSHFNKAVVCGGYTIHRCGLGCRPALHHHCPYCETTILKRGDFEKHVQVCKKTPPPTSATIPSPTTAALTTPAVRGTPSSTTAVLTTPSPTTAALTTPAVRGTPSSTTAVLTTPAVRGKPSPTTAVLTTPSPTTAVLTTPAVRGKPSPTTAVLTTPSPTTAVLTTPAVRGKPSPTTAVLTTPSPTTAVLTTPAVRGKPSPTTAVLTTPSPTTAVPTTPAVFSGRVCVRPVIRKRCPVCNILINKRNLKKHIDRKHTEEPIQDINATSHLESQCIDRTNGIFTVLKVTKGHSVPLHIQVKTWGEHHKVICESHECQVSMEVAQRSGLSSYQCKHIRSVNYCASSAEPVSLKEEILSEMVKAKWFSNEKKKICLTRQQHANSSHIPLSVQTSIGTPETKKFISVFEPSVSYYSRLGRVMVVYDSKLNTWHCPCAILRRSCVHKYIAKWHLFQTQRDLFRTVFSREESPRKEPYAQSEKDFREDNPVYPPKHQGLNNMVCYILQHKKIPVDLPDDVRVPSPDKDYPKILCPDECVCQICPGVVPLSEPILITKKAKILTNWSIIEDVAIYCKQCPLCGMFYRYQEWKDHLHNFDDHNILAIPLCLTLRSLLQVHTSVSRAVNYLEDLTGLKFPAPDTVLHAYLHFEALVEHEYRYSCITCGDHPAVVIMDLHKKGVFHFSGMFIIIMFTSITTAHYVFNSAVIGGAQNPFAVKPTYHFWAPWIGKRTRRSDNVLNTEFEKVHSSKSASETAEITVTEERLKEELQKQKVIVIRKLCKECGLDSTGSRSDLLLRLSNEMKSRQTYDKIFEKIWGASGGWGVIMCPCGVVYSLKCNLRAESPRDFVDLLFSWKHMPNIIIYDFARGLATHANLRAPESIPIHPHEGRLAEPTQENITLARSGNLKVSLPWLEEKKSASDPQGHPLTGSSDHYILSDRFHENNTKDSRDVLRKITIVPQLAGKINSQVAEQLFSKMRKNNYFLNMSQPSTHLFQMRTIIHHYNENKNNKVRTRLMKTFGSKLVMNMHGQAVLENSDISIDELVPTDIEMEHVTTTSMTVPTSSKCKPV